MPKQKAKINKDISKKYFKKYEVGSVQLFILENTFISISFKLILVVKSHTNFSCKNIYIIIT